MTEVGPQADHGRRLLHIGLWLLLLLGLSHALSRAGRLHHLGAIRWPSDLYALQYVDPGEVDLLVLGTSRAGFGLAPTAIDPCLAEALGRPARSWSWTRASAGLWSLGLLAREAVPRLRPRVVALELSPEMLSVRHYGHESSARGGILPEDLPECLAGAAGLTGVDACLSALTRPLESLAFLDQRHDPAPPQLRWMALHARGGQFCFGSPACRAHNTRFEAVLERRRADRLAEVIPKVRSERFAGFRIGPPHTTAWERLRTLLAEHDAQLIILLMPLSADYAAEVPVDAEGAFRAWLRAAAPGVPVLDRARAWPDEEGLFIDADHLNARGALRLSGDLCRVTAPLLRE